MKLDRERTISRFTNRAKMRDATPMDRIHAATFRMANSEFENYDRGNKCDEENM